LPAIAKTCPEPLKSYEASQLALLDPTGQRGQLFSRHNQHAAKVGDILRTKFKTGDPFAGVLMSIRRRGLDTAILLRNHLTRIGVELWVKVYSPNLQAIEIVQRTGKPARRARLTYLRKKEHDQGSVEKIVSAYQRAGRTLVGPGKKRVTATVTKATGKLGKGNGQVYSGKNSEATAKARAGGRPAIGKKTVAA
jgi:large subunit ribosomal protein L19